jgi:hypothetical protein
MFKFTLKKEDEMMWTGLVFLGTGDQWLTGEHGQKPSSSVTGGEFLD